MLLTTEASRDLSGKFIEVRVDADASRPVTGVAIRWRPRRDDTGDDMAGPRYLDLVGFAGLHSRYESGQIRLGVMHVHAHAPIVARLASRPTGLGGGACG